MATAAIRVLHLQPPFYKLVSPFTHSRNPCHIPSFPQCKTFKFKYLRKVPFAVTESSDSPKSLDSDPQILLQELADCFDLPSDYFSKLPRDLRLDGLKLELRTTDRVGLLADVTRILRENSLSVTRAEVTTRAGKAINSFYVRCTSGYPVDPKIIDSIRKTIGQTKVRVKGCPDESNPSPQESSTRFLFGGLFKSRSLCNFGLVRSYA